MASLDEAEKPGRKRKADKLAQSVGLYEPHFDCRFG
jgi:hypothetical protein